MIKFRSWISIFVVLSMSGLAAGEELIAIEQKGSGKVIKVEVIEITDGEVVALFSGKEFRIAREKLTEESLAKVEAWLQKNEEAAKEPMMALNSALGVTLFEGTKPLWNQPVKEIAKRLQWPAESHGENVSSYRLYPRMDYAFAGAHPYCATLYATADGKADYFSLVFANKGDFGSKHGMGEDHFKEIHKDVKPPTTLEEAIEIDARSIADHLTKELGEPQEQYYGEKEDKRQVKRWDFKGHSFILSEVEVEYVSLLIVPEKLAQDEGKYDFVKDSDLRDRVAKNVVRKENGDVYVGNIPMVNQGPKGYCAPATFERAMRYMLVPADMYLLATAATTQDGTDTRLLAESCKRIIRSKARKVREMDLDEDLDMRTVKKFIDKGVPILWQMRSLEAYNQVANLRSKEREKVTDYQAWAKSVQDEAEKLVPSLGLEANHHICMIIGYNEATNELAVSDSWGPEYELRWVHLDIARAVTSRGGFVIDL